MIWLPLIGALISRLHGSYLFPYKIVKSCLWAFPLTVCVFIAAGDMDLILKISLCVLCFGLCAAGKSTGHGNGMDLGTRPRGEDERLEFLIKWLHGKIPEYWYDVLLLSVTGVAAIFGAAIAFAFINPVFSGMILLGGALKGPAYIIGYKLSAKWKTQIGEFLTGFFAYLPLVMI